MGEPRLPGGRTIGPFGRPRLTERPTRPQDTIPRTRGMLTKSFCSGAAAGQGAVADGVAAGTRFGPLTASDSITGAGAAFERDFDGCRSGVTRPTIPGR